MPGQFQPLVLRRRTRHVPAVHLRRLRRQHEPLQEFRVVHQLLFGGHRGGRPRLTHLHRQGFFAPSVHFLFRSCWRFACFVFVRPLSQSGHTFQVFSLRALGLVSVRFVRGVSAPAPRQFRPERFFPFVWFSGTAESANEVDVDGPEATPRPRPPPEEERDRCAEALRQCRAMRCPYGVER